MVEVELRAMKVRAGQGRAAESQKPVARQIEIENLTNSLDLLKIQESSHLAHQVRNSKLVDDQDVGAYLRAIAKSMITDMPKGLHNLNITYQSDCGIYIGGILNDAYIIILELDFSYEIVQHPGGQDPNNQMMDEGQPGSFQVEKYGLALHDIIFDTIDQDIEKVFTQRLGKKLIHNQTLEETIM